MQAHPVPQNITGFEFKLIGFLTLRQFGYLAFAAILDFVLYSAKIPFLVILIIGGPVTLLALALAFLPVNDLPFERWLAAFLKTVYSPSVRVWHREPKEIGFLAPQFSIYLRGQQPNVTPRVVSDPSKLARFLETHRRAKNKTMIDYSEDQRLAGLDFGIISETPVLSKPNLTPVQAGVPHFKRSDTLAGPSQPPVVADNKTNG